MRILLTGSSGAVGSGVLVYLLSLGHTVTSIDLVPIPERILATIPSEQQARLRHHCFTLADHTQVEAVFRDAAASAQSGAVFDGVIHLSAIPHPLNDDARIVHNNNVTSTYNVLQTAAAYGVVRIVQASSVNATGLSYTPEGRQVFDELPLTEEQPMRAMDPYALSKEINELQARCLVRIHPRLRIASFRFHMVKPTYESATPESRWQDLFSWVSTAACARACLLGLTSEGWDGAEAFNIVAPEICWEGGISPPLPLGADAGGGKVSSLRLLERAWKGRYDRVDEAYWKDSPRRGFWRTDKAERLLGWRHDEE